VVFNFDSVQRRGINPSRAFNIYAEPSAEGFYKRLGAIKIGEGPFPVSPEVLLPHFLYIVPQQT
jgi:hypothetical protein